MQNLKSTIPRRALPVDWPKDLPHESKCFTDLNVERLFAILVDRAIDPDIEAVIRRRQETDAAAGSRKQILKCAG